MHTQTHITTMHTVRIQHIFVDGIQWSNVVRNGKLVATVPLECIHVFAKY